jgi:hypothetical protein
MGLMGKPRLLAGAFLFTVSIIAGRVELIRQFPGQKKGFILFGLWGFPRFWGLDRFWVGLENRQRLKNRQQQRLKNRQQQRLKNRQQQRQLSGRFGFAFTPAFGRVVFRFAVGFYGTAEAVPLSKACFFRRTRRGFSGVEGGDGFYYGLLFVFAEFGVDG